MLFSQVGKNCCGCSACIHICPKQALRFEENEEGFIYPQLEKSKCINCNLCVQVCPVVNQDNEKIPIRVYAAKNFDTNIRFNSSSGGIFSLLAENIIDDNGVVFGAKFNSRWEVVHDYTDTKENLALFRGSKYVQSYLGNSFKQVEEFLKTGRKVLFTGTPCQVAGLKKYLRRDYPNLITVDFVCHGVPSPKIWKMYLKEEICRHYKDQESNIILESDDISLVESINFRNKSHGWKNFHILLRFCKKNKGESHHVEVSQCFADNPYMQAFLNNLSLRHSCYNCPAKSGKSGSDFTIGDLWGSSHICPQFDDDKGISLVFVNKCTPYANLSCDLIEVNYEDAIVDNICVRQSVKQPINRDFFYHLIKKETFNNSLIEATSSHLLHRLKRLFFRKIQRKGGK